MRKVLEFLKNINSYIISGDTCNTWDKKLYKVGLLIFSVLILLSVLFYKERTVFLDNAYFLFQMTKNADFCIQRNRFISVLPQILPLIAIKLSLPLKVVSLLFSLGYALYHFSCYLLCGLLRSYRLAIALLFIQTLIVTNTFFWHLSELQAGISLSLVVFALLTQKGTNKQKMPILTPV